MESLGQCFKIMIEERTSDAPMTVDVCGEQKQQVTIQQISKELENDVTNKCLLHAWLDIHVLFSSSLIAYKIWTTKIFTSVEKRLQMETEPKRLIIMKYLNILIISNVHILPSLLSLLVL